jgi:hypothetical protein
MTPTDPQPQPWHRLAPRLGSDAEFAAVRGLLAQCGFSQERIFQRLGIAGAGAYKPVWLGGSNLPEAKDALDALIMLLMDGDYVAGETLARLLPAGAVEQLEALQLIGRDPQNPDRWFGGCTLFPTRGLLLASDRASSPDGARHLSSPDMVFPPAIDTTAVFISTLPETPCDALLDLGTGSGIAALDFARFARHAWGTDIASRSVQFAEFNQRLNGIPNATMLQGDLYAPVEGSDLRPHRDPSAVRAGAEERDDFSGWRRGRGTDPAPHRRRCAAVPPPGWPLLHRGYSGGLRGRGV